MNNEQAVVEELSKRLINQLRDGQVSLEDVGKKIKPVKRALKSELDKALAVQFIL